MPERVKKIILEEHFSTPEVGAYATKVLSTIDHDFIAYVKPRLADIGALRIADMDKNGIDISVLSVTTPGVQMEQNTAIAVKEAKHLNDLLATQIQQYPTRFAGFGTVALQDPAGAAEELERCIKQLGMKGAIVNGHSNGVYLDDPKFFPFWERAEALQVPIYLHPADSPVQASNEQDYPEMAGPGWGWTPETAGHVLRLIYGGVFDRFPKTTVILGHMGETLPFILWRLDSRYKMMQHRYSIKKMPSEYIQQNVMVTTAGSFSDAPLICSVMVLGADRIMFSVDYPYEYTEQAVEFIEKAPISAEDRERICHGNAERLLKL
jgi:2,3-dihydroxybenzoate decarboxylase